MTSKPFNPEKDLAPMPFDDRICLQALEMKKCGLAWRPHVGCFVWDPEEFIKPNSPFPGRVYFILSLQRFIEIFDTIEQLAEKLVWLNQQMDRLHEIDKDSQPNLYKHTMTS